MVRQASTLPLASELRHGRPERPECRSPGRFRPCVRQHSSPAAWELAAKPLQIVAVERLKRLSHVHLARDELDGQRPPTHHHSLFFDRPFACQLQDQPAFLSLRLLPEQSGEPRA